MEIWEIIFEALRRGGMDAPNQVCALTANIVCNEFLQQAFNIYKTAAAQMCAPVAESSAPLSTMPPLLASGSVNNTLQSSVLHSGVWQPSVPQPSVTPHSALLEAAKKSAPHPPERSDEPMPRTMECTINMTNHNAISHDSDIDTIARALARRISEEIAMI